MDIYTDYSGGPDTALELCPLCSGHIREDEKICKYVSKDYFDLNILPALNELGDDLDPYDQIRIYMIDSKLIPFPHDRGCKIEELKAIHKKMKNFAKGE